MMVSIVFEVVFIEGLWSLYLKYFIEITVGGYFPSTDSHCIILIQNIPSNILHIHFFLLL